MKISILLPYKENFSPIYPGAVSLFVKDTVNLSKYKKNITVYGNTNLKRIYNQKYLNLKLPAKKDVLSSQSKLYVSKFAIEEQKNKSEIIEVHNRPIYIKYLLSEKIKSKFLIITIKLLLKFLIFGCAYLKELKIVYYGFYQKI